MTSTITIRPTPAAELERGMLIRHHGETRQIVRVCGYDEHRVVIYFHDGSDVRWADAMVDVVLSPDSDPDPAPEPDPEQEAEPWPTELIIRVLDGRDSAGNDLAGQIALRRESGAYMCWVSGVIIQEAYDRIDAWEALSVVPTEAVRAISARLDELDGADPRTSPGCRIVVRALRVAEAARSLAQVADTGEAVD